MVADNLIEKLNDVLRDIFDDDTINASRDTIAADVENWDSMGHIRLVLAVEESFDVKFATPEISSFKNVGDLVDLIEKKLSS